jgi:hypothetical protein
MPNDSLKGLKVAILIEDGFEQVEMVEPRKALDQAGAETRIVSPRTSASGPGTSRNGVTNSRSMLPSTKLTRRSSTHCYCPAASSIPIGSGWSRKRSRLQRRSSMQASRWQRSVTALGRSSRPARRAGVEWPRGRRSKPIFGTPARSGWIRKSSLTAISCRAASLMTFRHLIAE